MSGIVRPFACLRTCTQTSTSSQVSAPAHSPPPHAHLQATPGAQCKDPLVWPIFDLGSSGCPDQTGFVSTGILKDYLRELPTPLITQPLYQVVLEAMAQGPTSRAASGTEGTRELLSCLPEVERVSWVPRWRRPVHPLTHAWPYLAPLRTGLESAFRASHHTGADTGIAGE